MMLTFKDYVTVLIAFFSLIVLIVHRRSGKSSHPAKKLPVNPKSGTEGDVNKDRRPGGE